MMELKIYFHDNGEMNFFLREGRNNFYIEIELEKVKEILRKFGISVPQ